MMILISTLRLFRILVSWFKLLYVANYCVPPGVNIQVWLWLLLARIMKTLAGIMYKRGLFSEEYSILNNSYYCKFLVSICMCDSNHGILIHHIPITKAERCVVKKNRSIIWFLSNTSYGTYYGLILFQSLNKQTQIIQQ